MKAHAVKIGGREFPLSFSLKTMLRLQEDVEGFDMNKIDEFVRSPGGLLDLMYEMAVSGAALADQKLDVSKDWMAERIPFSMKRLADIQVEIVQTLTDGMEMETEEEENAGREVDVVLEDIKKKDGKTGSPGEKSSATD